MLEGSSSYLLTGTRCICSSTHYLSIQSYLAPPLSTVFLIGIFWKRANTQVHLLVKSLLLEGAVSALAVGAAIGLLRLILERVYTDKVISNQALEFFVKTNFMHMAAIL